LFRHNSTLLQLTIQNPQATHSPLQVLPLTLPLQLKLPCHLHQAHSQTWPRAAVIIVFKLHPSSPSASKDYALLKESVSAETASAAPAATNERWFTADEEDEKSGKR
jgi:hypothetical protein